MSEAQNTGSDSVSPRRAASVAGVISTERPPRRNTTTGLPEDSPASEDTSSDEQDNVAEDSSDFQRIKTAPTAASVKSSKRTIPRARNLNREITYDFDDYGSSSDSSDGEHHTRPSTATTQSKEGSEPSRKRRRGSGSGPYSKFSVGNQHFRTRGRVSKRDGRLKISVNETANSGYLAKALRGGLHHHFLPSGERSDDDTESETSSIADDREAAREAKESVDEIFENPAKRPRLNIVIIVIGSRGDIQPFIRIGKVLQNDYGHRVRIATHPAFKDFIEKDAKLEFFSVGGNPSELMAFMVKNPGLIPNFETIKAGEIGRRRSQMYEMFTGMWHACVDEQIPSDPDVVPFVADAIIANPPSFAHIHIAERLGIPIHMMFTFPYSPTTQFPHPLANIKQTNVDQAYTNFMSYPLVDMMTWQGLGDLVNKFRETSLGLEPVSTLWAPGQLYRLEVPHTYLWSPSLVPKPKDWGPSIDIAGFVFLDLGSSFKPPEELAKFLDAGEPPVYIGFGSIVVDDPDKFTQMIFAAVKEAGVRALVSKGWGGFGGDGLDVPDNIFLLENTPHDWLFPRCRAVVHHGGAGTTAIGLKCAKPTMIVPFFGDQPFWGSMVAKARAGAFECIPYKRLTVEKMANGIRECLTEEAQTNVQKIADSIAREGDGAVNAVRSFHRSLPWRGIRSMRCSMLEERAAVWRLKGTSIRLSALAAELLVKKGRIAYKDLTLLRHTEWNDFEGPGEPITGAGMATVRTLRDMTYGVGGIPLHMAKVTRRRSMHNEKKKRHEAKLKEQETKNTDTIGNVNDSPVTRETTKVSALSADPNETLAEEYALQAGHGVTKSTKALVKLPVELSLAVAQGFHNAPRLYGDETVRRPRRITGFKSGLLAGRDEFMHGWEDAFTGLVKLPRRGMKQHGALGAAEGFAISLGGLVLKPLSAIISPWPFAAKGVEKEYHARRGDPGTNRYIRKERIIQGERELQRLEDADRVRQEAIQKVKATQEDSEHQSQHHNTAIQRSITQRMQDETDDRGLISLPVADRPSLPQDDLENTIARLKHGWTVITDLLETQQKIVDRGFISRVRLNREKKRWRETAALESVESAEKALQARKRGVPVEHAMAEHSTEVQQANGARLPGMQATSVTNNGPAGSSKQDLNEPEQESQVRGPSYDEGYESHDGSKEGRMRRVGGTDAAMDVKPAAIAGTRS